MCFSNARRPHQQQSFFRRPRIIPHKSLRKYLALLQRLRVLRCPRLPVGQVRHVTFKIAMLIAFGNPRALHHANGAFLHAAIAWHCDFACRVIRSRYQLPSRSSAQCAIFQRHVIRASILSSAGPRRLLFCRDGLLRPSSDSFCRQHTVATRARQAVCSGQTVQAPRCPSAEPCKRGSILRKKTKKFLRFFTYNHYDYELKTAYSPPSASLSHSHPVAFSPAHRMPPPATPP